ncbi:ER-associated protein degradation protein [Orobanche hederae]
MFDWDCAEYIIALNITWSCRARYGVQLENGPFHRRTADFLWMMLFGALSLLVLSFVPYFWSPFLGISLVFMLLYVWSREFPNGVVNIYGLIDLKAFYLPWAMLSLDAIFGSPIMPDLLGIIAGHLYYFLTVLHPLAGGRNILKTPALMFINSLQGGESALRQLIPRSRTGLLVCHSGEDLTG